jgi:Tol biopolymer transport system component
MRLPLLITALALAVTAVAAAPASATFPGHNGPIAYRTWTFENPFGPMFTARADGSGALVLTEQPGFFSDWRADGRRVAYDFFDANGNEQIATSRPDGGDLRVITSGPGIHEVPSWSPDGGSVVFDFSPEPDPETPGFHTRLWTMRADGSHARALRLSNPGFDVEPRFSPDGRWIAFDRVRVTDGHQAAFIVSAHGGRALRITPWKLDAEHPTWSPDSRWIVYDNAPDGHVQRVRPNGHSRTTIVPARPGRGAHKPWYSPDGKQILFMCENQGTLTEPPEGYNEDLCVMDADGSHIVDITNTPDVMENWPSWGPRPRG